MVATVQETACSPKKTVMAAHGEDSCFSDSDHQAKMKRGKIAWFLVQLNVYDFSHV